MGARSSSTLEVGQLHGGGFNYPHASAHLGCEVSCQGLPNRPALSLRPCFVEASPMVESCNVLESGPTRSLVTLMPSFRNVFRLQVPWIILYYPCKYARISCCKQGTLQTRLQMGMCKNISAGCRGIWRIRIFTAMYMSSADLLSIHVGACPGQYGITSKECYKEDSGIWVL